MNYLFYDVETPNRHNDSVCACAWILHDGEKEIGSGTQLIDPQVPFDPMNTAIHGIRREDVAGAPTFLEYWESTLSGLFTSSLILAHSAHFDMSVTAKALACAGIEMPRVRYVDTLAVFRNLFPGESCKLDALAARYSIGYKKHDAGADVKALSAVLDLARMELGFDDFPSMFEAAMIQPASVASDQEKALKKAWASDESYNLLLTSARNAGVDLTDVAFAFHGELQTLPVPRSNGLVRLIEVLGGTAKSVSGKTDYFVIFETSQSNSVTKAKELAAAPGSHLRIIGESAFLDILGYRTDSPDLDGPRLIRERKQSERAAAAAAAAEKERVAAEKAAARAAKKQAEAEKEPKPAGRPVVKMDREGNDLRVYPTVAAAAADNGVSTKVIRDCASGKQKTAAGFVWKYEDEVTEA